MAKAKAKARQPARPAPSSGGAGIKVLAGLALLLVVPFSLPTFILLFVTMLPTLVAALTDRSAHRFAWLSVGGVNFAATAPWLFDLWFGVYTIEAAISAASQLPVLMTAWMAAGFGYVMHCGFPPVASAILQMNHQRRVASLRDRQKALIELWGPGVAKADEDDLLL